MTFIQRKHNTVDFWQTVYVDLPLLILVQDTRKHLLLMNIELLEAQNQFRFQFKPVHYRILETTKLIRGTPINR